MSTIAGADLAGPTHGTDAAAMPRLLATAEDPSFGNHFRTWGPMPSGGPLLVREIEKAGLRGRGGASFPTARKLATVSAGRRPIVVANGTEGEPASLKDKALMVAAPHLILDGLSIAAETVGATEAIICVDRTAGTAIAALRTAIVERNSAGADVIGTRLETPPSRYVAGEESALVNWLNGGDSKPTFVPPRPFQRGVNGRPTLVNNVETLANLALIARFGAGWFREIGTPDDPGSALVSVLGDVARPGVYEFAYGAPAAEVLRSAGTGSSAHSVLAGGFAGAWLPARVASGLSFDRKSFASAGAVIGCGSMLVLGMGSCGLAATSQIVRWMASQTAGQCGPCVNGLPAIAAAVDGLAAGDLRHRWDQRLAHWLDMIEGRGACHHPDGTARMIRSALVTFAEDIANHRRRGPCEGASGGVSLPPVEGTWR